MFVNINKGDVEKMANCHLCSEQMAQLHLPRLEGFSASQPTHQGTKAPGCDCRRF